MPRPIWKGHLSFGLVMIPVSLYSAESPHANIDLDMLDSRDKSRVKYKRVSESTGREVAWNSVVKGYEYEDGKYVLITPEDFKRAADGIVRGGVEIVDFVDGSAISPLYYEKPYFVEPGKNGEKGYVLLREALKKSGRVGVARVVIQTREHMAALIPLGDGLVLVTMRFADELREPDELNLPRGSGKAKPDPREIDMAEKLIDGMTAEWQPKKYHDRYREALEQMIEEKTRRGGGKPPPSREKEEDIPPTYSIMDLLKKSVESRGTGSARGAKYQPKARGRRAPSRRKAG